MNSVGQNLKNLRTSRGQSMKEVGDVLGVHYTTIDKIERGRTPCTAHRLKLLADHFGVSAGVILDGVVDGGPHSRLRQVRMEAGHRFPASAIAAFGWNEADYLHHENGTREMDDADMERYATAFNVAAAWIKGCQMPDERHSIADVLAVLRNKAIPHAVRCAAAAEMLSIMNADAA